MIITQTPLRISFLGGGTDYPEYFLRHGGAVLGTAVDKSAYFCMSRFYSGLFDYSIRIAYRQVECVRSIDQLQHAPFRECSAGPARPGTSRSTTPPNCPRSPVWAPPRRRRGFAQHDLHVPGPARAAASIWLTRRSSWSGTCSGNR